MGPVRRQQPGLGQGRLLFLGGQRGDFGYRRSDFGLQIRHRVQIDVQIAAYTLTRQRRDTSQPPGQAAEELRNPVRTA